MADPSPEAIELAIEVVNLIAGRGPKAAGPACTLESLAFDREDRLAVALEIECRWGHFLPLNEHLEWITLADVAVTIGRVKRNRAA